MKSYFIHTPKTGGTSLKKYANITSKSRPRSSNSLLFCDGFAIGRTHLTVTQNLMLYGPNFYHRYDRIAGMVRDPVSRFLSASGEMRINYPDSDEANSSLDQLLIMLDESKLMHAYYAVFHPQWRFFFHPEVWLEENVEVFRKGGCRVADKIFKFETYEESCAKLLEFLQFPPKVEELTVERKTPKNPEEARLLDKILRSGPDSKYWKARCQFYRLYAKDFYLFGYTPPSSPDCVLNQNLPFGEMLSLVHDPFWANRIKVSPPPIRDKYYKCKNAAVVKALNSPSQFTQLFPKLIEEAHKKLSDLHPYSRPY